MYTKLVKSGTPAQIHEYLQIFPLLPFDFVVVTAVAAAAATTGVTAAINVYMATKFSVSSNSFLDFIVV